MNGLLKIALLFCAMIGACILSMYIRLPGNPVSRSSRSGDKLVIITPHWDGIRNEFQYAFSKWRERSGRHAVNIEWLDPGGTSDCIRYVKSEFKRSPGGIGIDLLFGGGTDPYIDLKKQGILESVSLDTSILNAIPAGVGGVAVYDTQGYWFGTALSGFGIMYNKWVTDWMRLPVPAEWKDLASPEYFSWIGAADPRNSGTMHIMFEIILQAYGWEEGWKILSAMAANARAFSKNASEVPKMVAKGDMALGLAVDFYAWAEVAEAGEEKVGFIMPKNLTVVSADAIGLLKGAPHRETAIQFINYVLSDEGQRLWFLKKGAPGGPRRQELGRMPVRPDIYKRFSGLTSVRDNPYERISTFRFDQELASKRWMLVNDLFGAGCIEPGDLLHRAWRSSIRNRSVDNPLWKSLPISADSGLGLATGVWNDAVRKNAILLQWHTFFTRKYTTLAVE